MHLDCWVQFRGSSVQERDGHTGVSPVERTWIWSRDWGIWHMRWQNWEPRIFSLKVKRLRVMVGSYPCAYVRNRIKSRRWSSFSGLWVQSENQAILFKHKKSLFYFEGSQTLDWLPREDVEFPSLEMFKTQVGTVQSNLL